jgi:hypothetical protein
VSDEAPPLNLNRVLGTMRKYGVKYVLVGGFAGTLYGAKRATTDIDICPAWDRENLTQIVAALRELGAIEKGTGLAADLSGIYGMETTNWRTQFGDVDVLLGIPNKSQYEKAQYKQLAADALVLEVADDTVLVASLPAIIRSKELADREKDPAGRHQRRP